MVPMQPLEWDEHGVIRFRANAIVKSLLEWLPIGMNEIAEADFSDEDRRQFAQLIGYSVGGYGDLPYAEGHWTVAAADEEAARLIRKRVADEQN